MSYATEIQKIVENLIVSGDPRVSRLIEMSMVANGESPDSAKKLLREIKSDFTRKRVVSEPKKKEETSLVRMNELARYSSENQ